MEKNLKIVTYNIRHGANASAIIRNIARLSSHGVSVFCLQEFHKYKKRPFLLVPLLKILGDKWRAEYLIEEESHDLGLCILWKTTDLELETFEAVLLPKLNREHIYEKAFQRVMDKYEKLAHKYLGPAQRAALIGNFRINGIKIQITNVHLDWQGGFRQRELQLRHVRDYLKSRKSADFEIFCGDFNTLGFYRFSQKRLKKVKSVLGEEFINAFQNQRTTSYLQMLDQIFVKNLKVAKAQILRLKGSDHFPLLAEIKV